MANDIWFPLGIGVVMHLIKVLPLVLFNVSVSHLNSAFFVFDPFVAAEEVALEVLVLDSVPFPDGL
ncbi:hypothetical protein D3C73_1644320 [compost metagenome]